MRDLDCNRIEIDEIWGFIGKKKGHVREDDDPTMGDVWTYCALDAETKLVPSYFVAGARNMPNTITFISDLALRLKNRIQLSSDAMISYSEAIGLVFGEEIDYAQIIKTFGPEESKYSTPERKYSRRASPPAKRSGRSVDPIQERFQLAISNVKTPLLTSTLRG